MTEKLKVLDLFSGIGGFSLGLERTGGFETVAFCEIEKFPQKVLTKHWPEVPIYEDVRELTRAKLSSDGITTVDIITGGFPCQDISLAAPVIQGFSRGKGLDGERSGLWSECKRLIGELQPSYAIFENVPNLLNGEGGAWFRRVLWDIQQVGYDAEWHCIPAANVGLPHIRNRVWIIAYPHKKGLQGLFQSHPKLNSCSGNERQSFNGSNSYSDLGLSCVPKDIRMDDGLPNRSHRVRALGNTLVPQIPEMIGYAILEAEKSA